MYVPFSFHISTNSLKIVCLSESVSSSVKCRQRSASMTIKVLLQVAVCVYSEFKSFFVVFGTQFKAKNLPSKFDLFLPSHHGLKLTQEVRVKKWNLNPHCSIQVVRVCYDTPLIVKSTIKKKKRQKEKTGNEKPF